MAESESRRSGGSRLTAGLAALLLLGATPSAAFAPRPCSAYLSSPHRSQVWGSTRSVSSFPVSRPGVRLWAAVPEKGKVRGVQQQQPEPVDAGMGITTPYRDALIKTAFSIVAALVFGAGVWATKGADSGIEYYAG